MKYILTLIIGICICYATQLYGPWWIFSPVVFILFLCVYFKNASKVFTGGFLIVSITWLLLYFLADKKNDSIMSTKIATLFHLPGAIALFSISALVMGIIGGLSAMSAHALKKRKN